MSGISLAAHAARYPQISGPNGHAFRPAAAPAPAPAAPQRTSSIQANAGAAGPSTSINAGHQARASAGLVKR